MSLKKNPNRKPRKIQTIASLVEKAAVDLQKLVRLKASNNRGFSRCVSCSKWVHYKNCDAGHYFSRRHLRLKLYEENIHVQCKGCNMRMGCPSVRDEYRTYMYDMYGVRRVKAMKRLTKWSKPKFNMEQVKQFRNQIRDQIKIQLKRLGE